MLDLAAEASAQLRDQQATPAGLPASLEVLVGDYAKAVNELRQSGLSKAVQIQRISRSSPATVADLIQTARRWRVESAEWSLVADASDPDALPTFTARYRHLLNISAADAADDDEARWRSGADKSWSAFSQQGFSTAPPPAFDVHESARRNRQEPDNMDWDSFELSGFTGRETVFKDDLDFSPAVAKELASWPESRRELFRKLHASNVSSYGIDMTPQDRGVVVIDELFLEAWADAFPSGGFRASTRAGSTWALLELKMRTSPTRDGSGRLFLCELNTFDDLVPPTPEKPRGPALPFLRSKTKKRFKPATVPESDVLPTSSPAMSSPAASTVAAPVSPPTPRSATPPEREATALKPFDGQLLSGVTPPERRAAALKPFDEQLLSGETALLSINKDGSTSISSRSLRTQASDGHEQDGPSASPTELYIPSSTHVAAQSQRTQLPYLESEPLDTKADEASVRPLQERRTTTKTSDPTGRTQASAQKPAGKVSGMVKMYEGKN